MHVVVIISGMLSHYATSDPAPNSISPPLPANASLGQKAAAVALPLIMAGSANALTYDEIQGLTYNQVRDKEIATRRCEVPRMRCRPYGRPGS